MSESTDAILRDRFFHEGESTWDDVARRTADYWEPADSVAAAAIHRMIADKDALPNTPALANAGRAKAMGSACYVLPIHDSLTDGEGSIMRTLTDAAAVHQSGGGTGFDFSEIRKKGALVSSTGRDAPGPLNMLHLYSEAIGRVTQGGMRPGANMAIIDASHPDALEFVSSKAQEGTIHNFNISVALSDSFMQDAVDGERHASYLLDSFAKLAWRNGEPGFFFPDTVNRASLHNEIIRATNPCGEVPLRPYEACVLGSINLANHVGGGVVDYDKLTDTIWTLVRLLDNIIEHQVYPLDKIREEQQRYRKIGVGVMGWADLLCEKGIHYGSDESLNLAFEISGFIQEVTYMASAGLAKERGTYYGYSEGMPARRNLNCQVIAPTGTISRLAGCSFGIEPHFDVDENGNMESYVVGGKGLDENGRMIPFIDHNPYHDHPKFVPSSKVTFLDHLKMQAVWQDHVDQAVSKTVNCPRATTPERIRDSIEWSWQHGLKGFTVLRIGSRDDVVIGHTEDGVKDEPPVALDELCASGVCET